MEPRNGPINKSAIHTHGQIRASLPPVPRYLGTITCYRELDSVQLRYLREKAVDGNRIHESDERLRGVVEGENVRTCTGKLTLKAMRKASIMYSLRKTFMRPQNTCLFTVPESGSKY